MYLLISTEKETEIVVCTYMWKERER